MIPEPTTIASSKAVPIASAAAARLSVISLFHFAVSEFEMLSGLGARLSGAALVDEQQSRTRRERSACIKGSSLSPARTALRTGARRASAGGKKPEWNPTPPRGVYTKN